mmetsp:Transcript_2142/g.3229  ORF Transcript_2142/g.3229 Transcript_2142/m.3229 type:complete len:377 (-) Transcript_2142:702-1832(-)|eukprot:CAMPEP_0175038938 /NCGR_PEP_ID=MMETSP0052_2-20121109/206_1 /TAXON_ID=51329 ORGANISM="Polytomella parva, Strain SAG 63-3" /NCGR_SAMPLE_ID=MMETSP0052_2 /ASSEMBLY_ACC=CAM_ASM_000194 /LENGTH=376 /DNA_ID=CAMNT_0016300535 /DNA_START=137 /DNA_END=1270 /DNA_ORIENTATION=-
MSIQRGISQQMPESQARGNGGRGIMMMDELKSEVRRIVPVLSDDRYKGQAGKIGIIGGSFEYANAAYYAAAAALQVGVDLAHVFCSTRAASTIKSYSPDLLVHPYFPELADFPGHTEPSEEFSRKLVAAAAAEVESWFSRLDVIIVGPGLGRDPVLLDIAREIIRRAVTLGVPLVLDGDGLFLVARDPDLVQGYPNCILTPNLNEFRRLSATLGVSLHGSGASADRTAKLLEVSGCLGGPTIVSKGPTDAICDGYNSMLCTTPGGAKRCGNLGDILSGCVAAFVAWSAFFWEAARGTQGAMVVLPEVNPMLLASYGGCLVARTASACAFSARRRSMLASDVLQNLGAAMDVLFDHSAATGGVGGGGGGGGGLDQNK